MSLWRLRYASSAGRARCKGAAQYNQCRAVWTAHRQQPPTTGRLRRRLRGLARVDRLHSSCSFFLFVAGLSFCARGVLQGILGCVLGGAALAAVACRQSLCLCLVCFSAVLWPVVFGAGWRVWCGVQACDGFMCLEDRLNGECVAAGYQLFCPFMLDVGCDAGEQRDRQRREIAIHVMNPTGCAFCDPFHGFSWHARAVARAERARPRLLFLFLGAFPRKPSARKNELSVGQAGRPHYFSSGQSNLM